MAFKPDTSVKDMVVLVTDKKDPMYGRIGRMLAHDWKEMGMYQVCFADGTVKEYPDGMCKGDAPSPVKAFYRKRDEKGKEFESEGVGPKDFALAFFGLNVGNIDELKKAYLGLFGEPLPV